MNENERTCAIAKAAAYALQTGTRRTVFCKGCKTAFLSGPTHCKRCGKSVTEEELIQHIEDSSAGETSAMTLNKSISKGSQIEFAPRPPGRRGAAERLYEYKDEKLTLLQLSKRHGISKDTLRIRLDHGWTMERALTEPVHVKGTPVKRLSRISHPDYVPNPLPVVEEHALPKPEVGIAVVPSAVLEQRLKLADDVASIKPELIEDVPASVKLIRERCARLDEIDYEISLLLEERRRIMAKLEGKE